VPHLWCSGGVGAFPALAGWVTLCRAYGAQEEIKPVAWQAWTGRRVQKLGVEVKTRTLKTAGMRHSDRSLRHSTG